MLITQMKRVNDRRNRVEKGIPCFDTEQSLCQYNAKRKSGKDSTRPVRKASALSLLIVLLLSCGLWFFLFQHELQYGRWGRRLWPCCLLFPPRCVSCSAWFSGVQPALKASLVTSAVRCLKKCMSGYVTMYNIIHNNIGIIFKFMLLFNKYEVSSLNQLYI